MRLVQAQVTDFQSVHDSTPFDIGDVTCLVGKNEAGKTALLKAIYRLNPINASDAEYDVTDDYPRSIVNDYENELAAGKRSPARVVRATFALESEDIAAVAAVYGEKCLTGGSPVATLCKSYDNTRSFEGLDMDDTAAIRHLVKSANLPATLEAEMLEDESVQAKLDHLANAIELSESATLLQTALRGIQEHRLAHCVYNNILSPRIPKFLYFDDYYQMKGQDNIEALQQRLESGALENPDHPLLGLLELAGLNLDQLTDPGRTEALLSKLEAAENQLTRKVLTYWSQNRHLRMKFDVRPAQPGDPDGMDTGMNIWGRVHDTKHMVSTALGTRSRGFVWFFSFLAWYSQLRRKGDNLILLLDEPGLSLHAKAQADLLRYFEEELVPHHQVIYSTHSPFMVDASRFDRVRIVQDRSIEGGSEDLRADQEGTKVTTDVLEASSDSLFPLQAALGYELHQSLFIGPNSLIVEGASDLLYIQAISGILQATEKEGLHSDWTITPVGGLDKVATFVALIGAQSGMNIAALVDYQHKDRQTIETLYKRKLLAKRQVLTFADFVDADEADIEDLFDPDFYLQLVNDEFGASAQLVDLPTRSPRIIARLKEYFVANPLPNGAAYNHYRPARYMMENLGTIEVPKSTLVRFAKAFATLNKLLPS